MLPALQKQGGAQFCRTAFEMGVHSARCEMVFFDVPDDMLWCFHCRGHVFLRCNERRRSLYRGLPMRQNSTHFKLVRANGISLRYASERAPSWKLLRRMDAGKFAAPGDSSLPAFHLQDTLFKRSSMQRGLHEWSPGSSADDKVICRTVCASATK